MASAPGRPVAPAVLTQLALVRRTIRVRCQDMFDSRFRSCAPYRHLLVVLTALAACFSAACRPAPATPAAATASVDTWAVVDGRQITRADVDQAYRRVRDASQTLSDEEILTAKLSLLNDLILQDILLAKARTLKLEVAQSDLDTAYADARKNMADEAFQQELTRRSLTPADMREGLRRELLTQKVIAQEVGSKIAVTEQEVTDAFNANRAQFNMAEESYHLAQIVVTPARDAQVANATGDDAKTPQEAAAKVQMLMERLKGGRIVPGSCDGLFRGSLSRRRVAGIWVSCRCPGSSRPLRHCAMRCSTRRPGP